jgi:hypothetical protein
MSVAVFKTLYKKKYRYGYQGQLGGPYNAPYTTCECGWSTDAEDEVLGKQRLTLELTQHRLDHLEGKI